MKEITYPANPPLFVKIWPIINIVLIIAIFIAMILFIRFIYVKLKKIDVIEKNTAELLELNKNHKI